jgi:hypothetical protein
MLGVYDLGGDGRGGRGGGLRAWGQRAQTHYLRSTSMEPAP